MPIIAQQILNPIVTIQANTRNRTIKYKTIIAKNKITKRFKSKSNKGGQYN